MDFLGHLIDLFRFYWTLNYSRNFNDAVHYLVEFDLFLSSSIILSSGWILGSIFE
jgi:hypothetical protein